jgi:triosephosphate isomerase
MKYVIANWKMHLTIRESVALAKQTLSVLQGKDIVPQVIVAPSFCALHEVNKALTRTRVHLCAQDVGPDRAGAFTGAVGAAQLEDVGVRYALVGHIERRVHFGETDEMVSSKLTALFASHIIPILCVGLHDPERELRGALSRIAVPHSATLCVAYEPPSSIGSGDACSPEEVVAMALRLRELAAELTALPKERILFFYGGSVEPKNAASFLREPVIDGVLVGGASLHVREIHAIINEAADVVYRQTI